MVYEMAFTSFVLQIRKILNKQQYSGEHGAHDGIWSGLDVSLWHACLNGKYEEKKAFEHQFICAYEMS